MKTIEFQILYNKNNDIHQEGYVEVPSDVEELPEWFYYDQNGFVVPREFTHHDGIGLTQIGATAEQESELQRFYEIVHLEEVDFIDEVILTADEDEHRTYIRDDITIIVNDGAKAELEIFPSTDGDYWAILRFSFNGEHITMDKLSDVCDELCEDIDGLYADDRRYFVDGDIEREISKYYWSDDRVEKEISMSIEQEILDKFRLAFARQLVLDAEIGDKYGDVLEQCLDDETDDEWLFKFSTAIKNNTVDELIENEGFEIP